MSSNSTPARRKPSISDELVGLHREIYRRNQHRINESVFGYTEAFRRYEREYLRAVASYQQRSDYDALDKKIAQADVVYVGDYHTLSQSQRTFLRLLRRVPQNRPVTLALEFVPARAQAALDAFQRGELDGSELLKQIDHDPSGAFGEWRSFESILNHARDRGYRVVGIDSKGSGPGSKLANRDKTAARILAKERRKSPESLQMVLIGELHIAPKHLPRALTRTLGSPLQSLTIYQNCHEIYWQLASRRLEHEVEVVRISRDEYYIVDTLPIVAQQSFLNWLDFEEEGDRLDAPEENFRAYANLIAEFFDLDVGEKVDEVEVVTVVDLSFLQRLRRRGDFSAADVRQIKKQILRSESYFIPRANMVYLGNLSINHAAEEASHFLRFVCSGSHEPRMLVDAFYGRCLEEAVGFLGSKLLNHKRKAPELDELRRMARSPRSNPAEKAMATLVLKHARMEAGKTIRNGNEIYECDMDTFNAVTHVLGYQLGEKLYYALVSGVIEKHEIRDLYFEHFEEDNAALTTFFYLSKQLQKVRVPSRDRV